MPPRLSVVVVIYEMEREARRALHSFSAAYQRDVCEDDYEVIVVDSGSARPFNGGSVSEFGRNFHYIYLPEANVSPVRAMRRGVLDASSDYLAIVVDGARIVTPGVIRYGLQLPLLFRQPLGLVLGFHIGPDLQSRSIKGGYNREVEDELIASIGWPSDGYRLFEISSAHDPSDGWFRLLGESNCTFLHRSLFQRVGAYDERFRSRGGGYVNYDLQTECYLEKDVEVAMVLGEGAFHQLHGGATSGTVIDEIPAMLAEYDVEYQAIRGRKFNHIASRSPHYVGHIPTPAVPFLRRFAEAAIQDVEELKQTIEWLHREVASRDAIVQDLRTLQRIRDSELASLREQLRRAGFQGTFEPPAEDEKEIDR